MIESVLFTISLFSVYVGVPLSPPPLPAPTFLFSCQAREVVVAVSDGRVFCCLYCAAALSLSLRVLHECTYFFLFPGAQRGAVCTHWHGCALAGVVLGDSILASVQPQTVLSTAETSREREARNGTKFCPSVMQLDLANVPHHQRVGHVQGNQNVQIKNVSGPCTYTVLMNQTSPWVVLHIFLPFSLARRMPPSCCLLRPAVPGAHAHTHIHARTHRIWGVADAGLNGVRPPPPP